MSKYKYECVIEQVAICNDDSVYPAMRELVEKEGMSVRAAAKFVERDSDGRVTQDKAREAYRQRTKGGSETRPLKRRNTVKVENVNVFDKWNKAMNKCLDFGSKILNNEVSWKTSEEKKAVQDCFESVDKFLRLYAGKVKGGKVKGGKVKF